MVSLKNVIFFFLKRWSFLLLKIKPYMCIELMIYTQKHCINNRGNIISEATDYRERMKRYIPHLKKLDPAPRKFRYTVDENIIATIKMFAITFKNEEERQLSLS